MAIAKEEVRRIAKLANLAFTEEEFDHFTNQLNGILEHVAQLNRLDTTNIEATSHLGTGSEALRDDLVQESIPREEALANAPEADRGHFKVPKVIG